MEKPSQSKSTKLSNHHLDILRLEPDSIAAQDILRNKAKNTYDRDTAYLALYAECLQLSGKAKSNKLLILETQVQLLIDTRVRSLTG